MTEVKRLDLGAVSAYALAVEKGYEGTEEEFTEILTNALNYATQAQESASAAAGSAEEAGNYKTQAGEILASVNLAGTQQIEAIEAAGTQQTNAAKEAIEAKGKETLDSIPDSYEALQGDVTQLRGDLSKIDKDLYGEPTEEILQTVSDKYFNTTNVIRDGATTFAKNVPLDMAGTYCLKRAVAVGEEYILNGNTNGTNAIGLYVYTDAEGNVLSSQKAGTGNPVTVQINQEGYLYVNLRDYNSQTDYVKRQYYEGGFSNDINALNLTLPFHKEKVVNFGDSIFGNKRPPNDVSTALAKLLNATVYNSGFGGCRMAKHILTNYDPFCMYRLAYSIANNTWTLQDAAISNSDALPSGDDNKLPIYFPETLAMLKGIDFSTVKSITIAYGANDLTAGVRLDNQEDSYDTAYLGGALRYSLETLMSAFPQLQVFVCCPTYRFWMENGTFKEDSDTFVNSRGNTMAEYIELIKSIARAYHVKFIDNYYDLGIDKFNRAYWFPTGDGTHHNVKGVRLIAEHMANEMF